MAARLLNVSVDGIRDGMDKRVASIQVIPCAGRESRLRGDTVDDLNGDHPVRQYYVDILASRPHGTLYVGVTNDLLRRVKEHREDVFEGFTKRYGVHRLVHYEVASSIGAAIWREKRLKKWNRDWKIRLIESENPQWRDLYGDLLQ